MAEIRLRSGLENYSEDIQQRLLRGSGCWSYWIPGWASLIDALNGRLAEIDPDYAIDQIKEKFGGLRYYCTFPCFDSASDAWDRCQEEIGLFEDLSGFVCMECGMPGTIDRVREGGSYIACLCEGCREEAAQR